VYARTRIRPVRRLRPALTLVECVISIAIVGVMLVAALDTVGAARSTQRKTADRTRGTLLAQDLLSEILQQDYEDPSAGAGSFGLEPGEAGSGDRSLFDDVDDYDGWSDSPPRQKDGAVLTGFSGWERSVAVRWVPPGNIGAVQPSDTGVKQVTVTVTRDGAVVTTLVALRARAMDPQ